MCEKHDENDKDIEGKEEWVTGGLQAEDEVQAGIMAARIAVGDIEKHEETTE